MRRVLIKIDLCGSKEFFDRVRAGERLTREIVLEKMVAFARATFTNEDKYFREGTYYSDEGDAITLVLDRPTVALRCAIEFQKAWYSNIPDLPDSRIVLEYGDIETSKIGERARLTGEAFENLSKIEKEFTSGQIGVTTSVKEHVEGTLASFRRGGVVNLTSARSVQTWFVNYENPRTLEDSALAHALFIANPIGDNIRNRTFEVLIVECLLQREPSEATVSAINKWLSERGCPRLANTTLLEIASASEHLQTVGIDTIALSGGSRARFEDFRKHYESDRSHALSTLRDAIAAKVKALEHFDFQPLLEEYLCAVCLEIRMMANYFRATNSLFDRLAETSEFDFVLKRHFAALSDKPEEFGLLKRLLLEALRALALKNNGYIAAIFHNVLMLYYLNRTSSTSQGTLPVLREKHIALDTNAFYSLRCDSMLFHEVLQFSIPRLVAAGARVTLFDCSLDEYNQSLDTTLHNVKNNRGVAYMWKKNTPFIWTEYTENRALYQNNFDYCVAIHRVPKGSSSGSKLNFEKATAELKTMGIELLQLVPFKNQRELGQIYTDIHTAKDAKDRAPETLFSQGIDLFHARVLHDANCVSYLMSTGGSNPHSSKTVFVTCDFYLARIRKARPDQYEFITTAPEFYEFMLPYLFAADAIAAQPVETPNFLLAAAISAEMQKGVDLRSLFGLALQEGKPDDVRNYEILSGLQNDRRFGSIKTKWLEVKTTQYTT